MKACTSSIDISDEVFNHYKQDAEEIERLIEIAKKNYIQIERLRQSHAVIRRNQKLLEKKKTQSRIAHR